MNIVLATETDRDAWDAYVAGHTNGLAYHRFAWKEAVERAYGFEGLYFLARSQGRVAGVLPTVHHRAPFSAGTLVSLPYCDVGGVLADDPETGGVLVAEARRWARRRGAQAIELRNATSPPITDDRLPITEPKVRMLLELPGSSDALMAGFKSKHRSQVRKPSRDGLHARLGGGELVDAFYGVFAENMRDLGSPVHSRRWIVEVVDAFRDHARVAVVFLPDGKPAAGGVILTNGSTVSIPWASSLRRFNRLNPNMLLYWTFLSWAADNGFSVFDFGRSTPGEGTYRFKEQWGAKPTPLSWRRLLLDGNVEERATPPSPGRLRSVAERVISKLPLPVATGAGALVRRFISL